ncbi:nicotinate-nucleotide--dimethylbenzimidazole phosphoribosyltransferase [Streptomyces sp. NPDC006743]|uniref:nicotinate-nucleotide--dimethylbenzimidazole phosphoribosyltransferase n=1 Tax=Streptomyces sp. NPDC006743 TaxID=3154480 RepID=UPI0034539C2B
MTDTGQVPGEGLPESAGMVEQPGVPAHGAYTYLSESPAEDEDLLLPGSQGAWGNEVPPPAPEPVVEAVHEPGPHETGGRDSGSVDLSGVLHPDPTAVPPVTPPRRPLHLGPPTPDASASPVRSLADRGPADAPVRQPGPAATAAGPEHPDAQQAGVPQPLGAPQGAAPWGAQDTRTAHAPVAAPAPAAPQADARATAAETVVPDAGAVTEAEPAGAAQAAVARLAAQAGAAAPETPAAAHAPQPAHEAEGTPRAADVQVPEGAEPAESTDGAQDPAAVAAAPGTASGSGSAPGEVTGAADPAAGQVPEGADAVAAQEPEGGPGAVPAGDAVEAAPGAEAEDVSTAVPAAEATSVPAPASMPAPTPQASAPQAVPAAQQGQAGQADSVDQGAQTIPVPDPAAPAAGEASGTEASAEHGPTVEAAQIPQAAQAPEDVQTPQAAQAPGADGPADAAQPADAAEQAAPQAPVAEETAAPAAEAAAPGDQATATEAAAPGDQTAAEEAAAPGDQTAAEETAAPQQSAPAEETAPQIVPAEQAPAPQQTAADPQAPQETPSVPVAPQDAVQPQPQPQPQPQLQAPGAPGAAVSAEPEAAASPPDAPAQGEAPTGGVPAAQQEESVPTPVPPLAEQAAPTAGPGVPDPAPAAETPAAQEASGAPAAGAPETAGVPAAPAPAEAPHTSAAPQSADASTAPGTQAAPQAPEAGAAPAEAADPAGTPAPAEAPLAAPASAPLPAPALPAETPEATTPAGPAADAPVGEFVPVDGTVPTTPHLSPTPPHPIVVPQHRPGAQQPQPAAAAAQQPQEPVAAVPAPRAGDAVPAADEPDPDVVQRAEDLETRGAGQEDSGEEPREEDVSAAEAPRPAGPAAPGYDEAEREAVLKVMRERRDIRNGFRGDPIPHEVLLRVLEAAHHAPSVGHSQPWDFVVIRSADTRRAMHELAMRQRDAYAKSLPKGRAKQFRELKIEAILETPVNIVVTADPTRGGRHTLGRHTQPQMAPYSAALAVENLWLAARAEGLGVGWVSFFDEREMVRALGLPEHLEVIAYLCVGYVDEFPDEPELMQAGWSKRRPLSWVVHEETYGRRALPGEDPHDLLAETVAQIRPLDAKALGEAWERQKRMTKPAGALGMLEIISAQLSGLSRQCPPPIPEPAAVAIFAGDHGVHAQGVTPWPQEVTAQMVANFLGGGAVCNAFASQVGAEVCVVDVGVAADLPATPGLLPRKIRGGTSDMTTGPAMTREEARKAIEVGIETARDLVAAGNKALLTGEMGIANTTASAALISVYTGADPAEVTGRGTGINDETLARKTEVVRRALEVHRPDPADPIGVLAAIGGFEHAAMVGLLLGGASLRTPVILDGVSAGAAALVARAIAPEVLAACIAGHRSAEPGHVAALNKLGLRPLVDLDLRLGEGTGALLALPLVQSTARAMHEVATFDSAGVTEK